MWRAYSWMDAIKSQAVPDADLPPGSPSIITRVQRLNTMAGRLGPDSLSWHSVKAVFLYHRFV